MEAKGQREAGSEGSERGLDGREGEKKSRRGLKQLGLAARDAQEGGGAEQLQGGGRSGRGLLAWKSEREARFWRGEERGGGR